MKGVFLCSKIFVLQTAIRNLGFSTYTLSNGTEVQSNMNITESSPTYTPLSEKGLLCIAEFMTYASVGRNTAIKLSQTAHCRVAIGRRVLIDRVKFDEWCHSNCE